MLEADAIAKRYPTRAGELDVLRGVTLALKRGEAAVIVGPSGSGKSTLLNILGAIDRPSDGTVLFRGTDIAAYSERQLTLFRRNHVGFVFQFYNLMPSLTAEENVEMATQISAAPMEAAEALRIVGLDERRTHFPSQLSGGEQQRVAIARALAKRPDVLLCDEPTGALDYSTGKIVLEALQHVNRRTGTSVITVTHNAAIGGMADRVVRLMDGGIRDVRRNERPLSPDQLEW